jgi:uncharacterized protein (DUF433 family)
MITDAMIDENEKATWNAGGVAVSPKRHTPHHLGDAFLKPFGGAIELVPPLEMRLGEEWGKAFRHLADRKLLTQQWFAECVANGFDILSKSIDIDPEIRGGVPVLRGTRFTVAQALAELAELSGVTEFSEEFDIDPQVVKDMLDGLALVLQRPRVQK